MTTQQPQQQNTTSPDEVSAAFAQSYGAAIGRLTFEKLQLEKQMQALQAHCAETEAALINLKQENSRLLTNHIQLEGQIHNLEKELEVRPTLEQMADLESQVDELIEAGPTVAQTAARDLAKVVTPGDEGE